MTRKVKIWAMVVMAGLIAYAFIGQGMGVAADLSIIIKEATAKEKKFQKEVWDMKFLQEVNTISRDGQMNCETKIFRKGKKTRIETKVQLPCDTDIPTGMEEMATIIIDDGKDVWMVSSFMGKKRLTPEEAMDYSVKRNWWEFVSPNTKILGKERLNQRDCYVIDMGEDTKAPFTKIWIDKKELLSVQCESQRKNEATILWRNSDFRKIKGTGEVPFKTEMYVNGKLTSTSRISSLEVNKGLSEDLFDPDKIAVGGSYGTKEIMKEMMKQMGGQ